jgi:pyruvate/2-oxoglutarate dehydrogenase complex dihydrolipoamide acyltransferase (E2) component
MGCDCTQGASNMSEDVDYVELAYQGQNNALFPYGGYMNRRYQAKKGSVIPVHPEDVPKLLKLTDKGGRLFARREEVEPSSSEDDGEETAGGGEDGDKTNGEPPVAIDATDGAQELAAEFGLDLSLVTGTGKDGRILKADVESYLNAQSD